MKRGGIARAVASERGEAASGDISAARGAKRRMRCGAKWRM